MIKNKNSKKSRGKKRLRTKEIRSDVVLEKREAGKIREKCPSALNHSEAQKYDR